MIISHSRRFIFVHIHKSGGTSVELALDGFLSWYDLLLGSSLLGEAIDDPYRQRFGLNKHSSIADIERACGAEICRDYFAFATVRHPLHRMCSLYNYVGWYVNRYAEQQGVSVADLAGQTFTEEVYETAPELAWYASLAFMTNTDFSSFIRDERLIEDAAFRTQVSRLRSSGDGMIRVKVLRIERCADWIPKLKNMLELPLFSLPHANQSETKLITPKEVSTEDKSYIEQIFQEDYLAFDYPPVL